MQFLYMYKTKRYHEGQDDTYMILASIEKNEEGVEVYVPLDEEDEVLRL